MNTPETQSGGSLMRVSSAIGIEQMQRALNAAGWTRKHGNLWQSPDGRYYRGPALAYHMMMGLPWPPPNHSDRLAALQHVAVAVGCCAAFYLVCKACAFMDDNHHRVWTNQTVVNGEYQAWRKDLDDLSILFWWGILPLVGIGSLAGLFSSVGESFRQSKERAVTCFAYSIIALAFLFYAMPSGKELSKNGSSGISW